MYLARQTQAKRAEPDQMPQNAAPYQVYCVLPRIQQITDTSRGSKIVMFKF